MAHAFLNRRTATLLPLMVLLGGCGQQRIPVRGVVVWRGAPVPHGQVVFFPTEGRPAYGDLDSEGRFSMNTLSAGDGVMAGEYRVVVQSDLPINPKDAFGDRYSVIPIKNLS
jgi:hypothetical protein